LSVISGVVDTQILNVRQKLLTGWQRRQLEHPRQGLHVSDLIGCRRQKCFSHLDPNPQQPSDKQIRNFMGGEWKHRALQELLGMEEFSCEEEIIWNDIIAHPDAIWRPGDIPTAIIEIKTTNSVGVSRKCYDSHIKQLKNYLSIMDLNYGKIFYMYLGTNLDEVF